MKIGNTKSIDRELDYRNRQRIEQFPRRYTVIASKYGEDVFAVSQFSLRKLAHVVSYNFQFSFLCDFLSFSRPIRI